jgi:hypothetical protein
LTIGAVARSGRAAPESGKKDPLGSDDRTELGESEDAMTTPSTKEVIAARMAVRIASGLRIDSREPNGFRREDNPCREESIA